MQFIKQARPRLGSCPMQCNKSRVTRGLLVPLASLETGLIGVQV